MIDRHNHSENMKSCQNYIQALEAERCKIQVFQRELPLCLELVTQAIETCKKQLSETRTEYCLNAQSECNSEQTTSDVPVLEEFIPIKRASFSHADVDEEHDSKRQKNETNIVGNNGKKPDWLRSVQLWNQNPDPSPQQGSPKKVGVLEVKRNGSCGAFQPFKKEKSGGGGHTATPPTQNPENRSVPPASTSSTAETGGDNGNKKGGKEGQSPQRKVRRCWSPELHKRFLQALQQLGGSQVATPKQIRELMKVDGLTNDEVKSHLQKYRLHTRRLSPSIHTDNNTTAQAPQFVVVPGGIWMHPGMAAAAPKAIYAPTAAAAPLVLQETSASPKQEKKPANSDDRPGEHSPAPSSLPTR